MSFWDWFSLPISIASVIINGYVWWRQRKLASIPKELEQHRQVRKALYEKFADPETIATEMEAGARAREMYDANRTTLPRDDGAAHAKVYRPKLRGAKPGSGWRPNRVN